jgi:hypothetical protein
VGRVVPDGDEFKKPRNIAFDLEANDWSRRESKELRKGMQTKAVDFVKGTSNFFLVICFPRLTFPAVEFLQHK